VLFLSSFFRHRPSSDFHPFSLAFPPPLCDVSFFFFFPYLLLAAFFRHGSLTLFQGLLNGQPLFAQFCSCLAWRGTGCVRGFRDGGTQRMYVCYPSSNYLVGPPFRNFCPPSSSIFLPFQLTACPFSSFLYMVGSVFIGSVSFSPTSRAGSSCSFLRVISKLEIPTQSLRNEIRLFFSLCSRPRPFS